MSLIVTMKNIKKSSPQSLLCDEKKIKESDLVISCATSKTPRFGQSIEFAELAKIQSIALTLSEYNDYEAIQASVVEPAQWGQFSKLKPQ